MASLSFSVSPVGWLWSDLLRAPGGLCHGVAAGPLSAPGKRLRTGTGDRLKVQEVWGQGPQQPLSSGQGRGWAEGWWQSLFISVKAVKRQNRFTENVINSNCVHLFSHL